MHDFIIIGGGPTAVGAAIYALGKQLDVVIIAHAPGGKTGSHQQLAGQLAPEEIAGENAVQLLQHQIQQRAVVIRDRVARVSKPTTVFQVVTDAHGTLASSAVLVATGATPRPLDVPGAAALAGQGLGYSITTHAHLLGGKTVAVVGTTERALRGVAEVAATAAQVHVVAHDAAGLSTPLAQALHRRPNVKMWEGYTVRELRGSFSVETMLIARNGDTERVAVDAVFVDLGLHANSACVRPLVHLTPHGFIAVNERNETGTPGLYAAGDVTSALAEQKLVALGDGTKAAVHAYDYILWRRWADAH